MGGERRSAAQQHALYLPPIDLGEAPGVEPSPVSLLEMEATPEYVATVKRLTPSSSPCLGGCSQRGICFEGKCFCDPGWLGDDCGREAKCETDCDGHGVCAYGICFCDPGWEGESCSDVVPCLNDCSGHGTCANAKCYCNSGWRGADCSMPGPTEESELFGVWTCVLIQVPVALIGGLLGWGAKRAVEQRQRAKMREILQSDAQRPFASGGS